MSSRSSSERPRLRRESSSSSSLKGLENPWPSRPSTPRSRPSTPRSPRVDSIINLYLEKPLPMTPPQQRPPPSPLNSVDNAPPPPSDERHPETTLPTRLFRKISVKRSSASRVPEKLLLRPYHGDGAQHQLDDTRPKPHSALSEIRLQDIHPGVRVQTPDTSKEPRFGEWKAPVYKPPLRKAQTSSTVTQVQREGTTEPDAIPRSLRDELYSTFEPFKGQKWQPEEYQALVHDISPQSPQSPDTTVTESSFEPSPITPVRPWSELIQTSQMAPRISDVMEYPAMIPEFLETENERPRYSEYQPPLSASFGLGEMMGSSQYERSAGMGNRGRNFERTHRPGSAEPQSQISGPKGLGTKHQRRSLQHGVAEAYDLIHRRIASGSKHKPEPTQQRPKNTADISTDQEQARSGVKLHMSQSSVDRVRELSAVLSASRASAPSPHDEGRPSRGSREINRALPGSSDVAHKKERFSGKKLIAALQNGPEKVASRAKDISSHRLAKGEELKKKIVLVLPGQKEGEEF